MSFITPVLILFLLISCGRSGGFQHSGGLQSAPKNKPENFPSFFQKFTTDSVFQRSRIAFPVDYYEINWESEDAYSEALVNHPISAAEYRFIDLSWHDSLATRPHDAYTRSFDRAGDTMKVVFRGVDNGIHWENWFLLKQNQWWFIAGMDVST